MPLKFAVVLALVVVVVTLVSACASKPIIDSNGVNMARYQQDLEECEAYAEQVTLVGKAAGGAAAGAAVGAVIGAAVGNRRTAQRWAGALGTSGAARGVGRGYQEKDRVVKNCLGNRGYAVLN